MSLETNAVDTLPCVFDQLDELDGLLLLRVGSLDVVVVVVQLSHTRMLVTRIPLVIALVTKLCLAFEMRLV